MKWYKVSKSFKITRTYQNQSTSVSTMEFTVDKSILAFAGLGGGSGSSFF